MSASIPVALTIAGSDSSAGAGIQADLKTFSALGVYGLTAVTCVVAETPGRVSKIEPLSVELVREQIDVLLRSFPVAAIKTGLLFSAEIITEIARALHDNGSRPLVIDPVMVATSGDALLQSDAIEAYERDLFPLATLLSPNLSEAAHLLGQPVNDVAAMSEAGKSLARKYGAAVLLKGGHLSGDEAIDLLFVGEDVMEFSAPFSRGIATHGTGCTYSAAITAGLAAGLGLEEAIGRAKEFVSATIAQHHAWDGIHALNHLPSR
ncbi:MAG TPA: bifunctional hydroxymethylpyrimidine kinase/phosphomethylpyrimidine kinase [Chthoniobacterales bacterium]|nr:bifunctional hydroxymethylpyrimidine kinase/phosphomethylpyrimidine kinase [Chthoniobacterales bacterium]